MRINKLLNEILSTRRPTKNTQFCYDWMMGLIDKQVIKGRAANISYMLTNDQHKNITILVPTPEGDNPTTCFTSHTDTVDNKLGKNDLSTWVVNNGHTMIAVKEGGVLGADDGAGIYIMLRMIDAGVPGRYVFFSCEEQGRVGSRGVVRCNRHPSRCGHFCQWRCAQCQRLHGAGSQCGPWRGKCRSHADNRHNKWRRLHLRDSDEHHHSR